MPSEITLFEKVDYARLSPRNDTSDDPCHIVILLCGDVDAKRYHFLQVFKPSKAWILIRNQGKKSSNTLSYIPLRYYSWIRPRSSCDRSERLEFLCGWSRIKHVNNRKPSRRWNRRVAISWGTKSSSTRTSCCLDFIPIAKLPRRRPPTIPKFGDSLGRATSQYFCMNKPGVYRMLSVYLCTWAPLGLNGYIRGTGGLFRAF